MFSIIFDKWCYCVKLFLLVNTIMFAECQFLCFRCIFFACNVFFSEFLIECLKKADIARNYVYGGFSPPTHSSGQETKGVGTARGIVLTSFWAHWTGKGICPRIREGPSPQNISGPRGIMHPCHGCDWGSNRGRRIVFDQQQRKNLQRLIVCGEKCASRESNLGRTRGKDA